MSEQFEKGQLVAVRDSRADVWSLRIFDHQDASGQRYCRGLRDRMPIWWEYVVPAEDVWPGIFFGRERHV